MGKAITPKKLLLAIVIFAFTFYLYGQFQDWEVSTRGNMDRLARCKIAEYERLDSQDYTKYQSISEYCRAKEWLGELR